MKANLDRSMGHPIAARSRTRHDAAWGAMINPGTPIPGRSMTAATGHGNATYGHSDAVRGHPIAPPQKTGQPPIFPPLEQRFGFGLGIIARGLVGSKSRKRFESGMGPTHSTGMGHHRIDVTPVEYGADYG